MSDHGNEEISIENKKPAEEDQGPMYDSINFYLKYL